MKRVINDLKKQQLILKRFHDENDHRDKKKHIKKLLIDIDEIIFTKQLNNTSRSASNVKNEIQKKKRFILRE